MIWPGNSAEIRRLLAIRLDNIGDMVMLGPAMRTLRRALPEARLTVLASKAGAQIAPLLPWPDEVLVHRAVWQDASAAMPLDPVRETEFIEDLRRRQFDAAVVFTSFSQTPWVPAYACYLAGIPIRLGQSKEFGGSVLSQWVKPLPDETHQVDRNLHLLESAGFPVAGRDLELHVPEDMEAAADRLLETGGIGREEPFVLLAPGASCPARTYDMRRFATAAELVSAELHLPVVLVGASREESLLGSILRSRPRHGLASLVGKTSVPELAAVIRRCEVLLASHSGPMHIADAFDRPMVILFSGTDIESQWRPRKAPAALLRRPTGCAPCGRFVCPYHMECLDLPPEEVAATVVRLRRATSVERPR